MIYLDGEPMHTFAPTTYKYDILLPTGQQTMPDVYAEPMEAMQTVHDSITSDLQHTIYVTAEDGSTNQYFLSFILNPSDADTLAAIYADGELIQGFRTDSLYYAYTLPVGTDHIPALTWDAADQWQTITAVKAIDTPTKQITQINVVAGSGKKNIYTVEYTIAQSNVDTLQMIYVQADELEGFDPHTLDYHIYMAPGDTLAPSINWKEGDLYQEVNLHVQSLSINQEQIGWKQTLEVTAQDGHRRLYTLYFYFTYPLSTNTDLLNIYLNGVALASFQPDQYAYRVSVEEGLSMPAILVEKAEATQTVRIDTTGGNAVITVIAEDTTYQSTYTIQFDYKKSAYSYLAGIYQDDVLIDGFEPTVFEYQITLPYGTTQMPTFTYELGKEGQTVEIETIQAQRTTTYIITVTAPDEEAASTYTIQVDIAFNDNSALASLVIKGVALEGFDPDTTEYLITYPVGTDESEYATTQDIEATPQDANATVIISQNGTDIIIQVTAEDGVSTTIYTISQSIYKSSNALLSAIYINDQLIRGFDPEVLEYEYYVSDIQPTVLAIPEDSTASIVYGIYAANEPFYIYVTAEDGTEEYYTIHFIPSTIQTSTTPSSADVLFKHIQGTSDIVFATTRKNISVAVYNSDGRRVFYSAVQESSQNDVYLITDAQGRDQLVDVYAPTTIFSIPDINQLYFYVFIENDKNKIKSGKFFLAQ
jgi:hypothetical protein